MKTTPTFFLMLSLSLLLFPYLTVAETGSDPFCNPQDQAVLLKIKDYFGGDNGRLSEWDPTLNCCSDWDSVGCDMDYDSHPGRITYLTFSRGWGLSGPLPAEFGELPYLNTLLLAEEPNITGPIPQSFAKLTNLQVLDLGSNNLSGPIPAFFGKLKSLRQLDLSNNHLSGVIPSLPKKLTSLDVSSNQLCGAIPAGLKKFGSKAFQHNKCLCGSPLTACKLH